MPGYSPRASARSCRSMQAVTQSLPATSTCQRACSAPHTPLRTCCAPQAASAAGPWPACAVRPPRGTPCAAPPCHGMPPDASSTRDTCQRRLGRQSYQCHVGGCGAFNHYDHACVNARGRRFCMNVCIVDSSPKHNFMYPHFAAFCPTCLLIGALLEQAPAGLNLPQVHILTDLGIHLYLGRLYSSATPHS